MSDLNTMTDAQKFHHLITYTFFGISFGKESLFEKKKKDILSIG